MWWRDGKTIMTDMIRATAVSRGSIPLRNLFRFCREQRIPIVQCEVHVGAAFDPTMVSVQGSRGRAERMEEIVEARQRMARSGVAYKADIDGHTTITTGLLIRERDYALVALFHGGMRRGWMRFMDLAVYGDEGR
jgi:hypothetical protein